MTAHRCRNWTYLPGGDEYCTECGRTKRGWRARVADIGIGAVVHSLQLVGACVLGVRLLIARVKGILPAAMLVLAGCGDSITEPGTGSASIVVANDSGFDQVVEVRLGPCGERLETVAELEPGETQAVIVVPGCWRLAVYGHAPHGEVTTLLGTRLDLRAGETVRLRF